MDDNLSPPIYLIRLVQPLVLIVSVLGYSLGGGVAHVLGERIDWLNYLIGGLFICSIQLGYDWLSAFYDKQLGGSFIKTGIPSADRKKEYLKLTFTFQAGLAAFTSAAVMVFLLSLRNALSLTSALFFILHVVFVLALFLPPLRLEYSGFGEIIDGMVFFVTAPALGCLLQSGDLHRYLVMVTVPMFFLYLALTLALGLKSYAEDIRKDRMRLLNRIGWQRGVFLHNIFILGAFCLWCVASLGGLPWRMILPVFLAFPVGIFQIWQVGQIVSGAKPKWKLLQWSSYGLVIFSAYLLNFALWTG